MSATCCLGGRKDLVDNVGMKYSPVVAKMSMKRVKR